MAEGFPSTEEEACRFSKTGYYGCEHYRRKCQLVSPCCNKIYTCRFCHDEQETHTLDRKNLTQIKCFLCCTVQPLSQICRVCNEILGSYFCSVCKLIDDEDRKQYHCDGCGLCRVGGRENFFHCDHCQMCLPNTLQYSHKCIEEISKRNCPVCLEDIHTSRTASMVPPCGHLIHNPCFCKLLKAGLYACPTCGQSMINMKQVWDKLEQEISETPMPVGFEDLYCNILCRDCGMKLYSKFHTLGFKCNECGSFNTVREKGGLLRRVEIPNSNEVTYSEASDSNDVTMEEVDFTANDNGSELQEADDVEPEN